MGTEVRVLVGEAFDQGLPEAAAAAAEAESELHELDRRLSRFRADSELSLFNHCRSEEVPASELLREAVRAGLWGAERTGGLVDPTLLRALEKLGYASTREGTPPASLALALSRVQTRRPAQPNPAAAWRSMAVLDEAGAIRRPPGVMFDTGGIGKGLAADRIARRLQGYRRFAIDCGGDVRVGGRDPGSSPVQVEIRHPLNGLPAETVRIERGAVATSGIDVRLWRISESEFGHHLIDPATGAAAWTGVIGATALASTALEADVLAKAALLSGPEGASTFLGEQGGLVVLDDGRIERFGPLRRRPRVRLPRSS